MSNPKRIDDITIEDLKDHRWCYYHNDEKGYDGFEFVIPDSHPEFSENTMEMELAEFNFKNGKKAYGMYDGSESFHIFDGENWYSFWYGVAKPNHEIINELKEYLATHDLELPVEAKAIWSGRAKKFNGLQYIESNGQVTEIAI